MSNLQTYYFKLDFQKVDQHTGGKWLIHGTKRCKDNQLQSLEPKLFNQMKNVISLNLVWEWNCLGNSVRINILDVYTAFSIK